MISCPPLHSCRVLPLGQGSRVPSNVVAPTVCLGNSLSYAALTMTSLKPTTRTRGVKFAWWMLWCRWSNLNPVNAASVDPDQLSGTLHEPAIWETCDKYKTSLRKRLELKDLTLGHLVDLYISGTCSRGFPSLANPPSSATTIRAGSQPGKLLWVLAKILTKS